MDRVFYSGSVHGERESEAVVEVLRSGPQGLWPGRRVAAMERQGAALFGKKGGVGGNSGPSALYLAIELLGLAPRLGDRHLRADLLHRRRTHRSSRARACLRRLR